MPKLANGSDHSRKMVGILGYSQPEVRKSTRIISMRRNSVWVFACLVAGGWPTLSIGLISLPKLESGCRVLCEANGGNHTACTIKRIQALDFCILTLKPYSSNLVNCT